MPCCRASCLGHLVGAFGTESPCQTREFQFGTEFRAKSVWHGNSVPNEHVQAIWHGIPCQTCLARVSMPNAPIHTFWHGIPCQTRIILEAGSWALVCVIWHGDSVPNALIPENNDFPCQPVPKQGSVRPGQHGNGKRRACEAKDHLSSSVIVCNRLLSWGERGEGIVCHRLSSWGERGEGIVCHRLSSSSNCLQNGSKISPKWGPKLLQKWSKMGSKMGPGGHLGGS